MRLDKLRTLSDQEVRSIHEQTLEILQTKGVKVQSKRSIEFLGSFSGVDVDQTQSIVRFRTDVVERMLAKAPASFPLFNRRGGEAITIGGNDFHMINGHCAIYTYDADLGLERPMTLSDVELYARLADSLPGIRMIGIQGTPLEVEPVQSFRCGAYATIRHSDKPFHFTPETSNDNRAVLEMIRILSGSENLRQRPSVLVQHTPMSPLCWPGDISEMLIDNATKGIPISILSAPYSGVTSPYPLAGHLSIIHAEALSGIVMAQLARPGTAVVWGSSCATFDMSELQVLIGSPESVILRIGAAQLAGFCHLPSMTTAPDTESHTPDEQTAWEKMQTTFSSLAAGTNLLCNAGMFSGATTVSPEQLLLDAEMFATCERIIRGVEVSTETLALADIIGLPAGSSFLDAYSTVGFLQRGEHTTASFACRQSTARWKELGSRSVGQAAHEIIGQLIGKHTSPDISKEILKEIEELCKS